MNLLSVTSPTHYYCFSSLYRRYGWLQSLLAQVSPSKDIKDRIAALSVKFPKSQEWGIISPLALEDYLDDTSVESFLLLLEKDLTELEQIIFNFLYSLEKETKADFVFMQKSNLIGRLFGQDTYISPLFHFPGEHSLVPAFSLVTTIMGGGIWPNQSFLLRRQSESALSYELKECPHRKMPAVGSEIRNFACALQSELYRGFFEALYPKAIYQRKSTTHYCVDFVSNHR